MQLQAEGGKLHDKFCGLYHDISGEMSRFAYSTEGKNKRYYGNTVFTVHNEPYCNEFLPLMGPL